MSNNEQSNASVENAKKTLSSGVSSLLALKSANPKVFFGGLGLLVVFVLFLAIGGSEDEAAMSSAGGQSAKNVAVGKQYVLKSPNSYDDKATVQLVPVPGTMAAYDDGATDDKNPCKSILQGTHVSVMSLQDAYGKKDTFAQVKVEEGSCKDKDGWVLSVDLQ